MARRAGSIHGLKSEDVVATSELFGHGERVPFCRHETRDLRRKRSVCQIAQVAPLGVWRVVALETDSLIFLSDHHAMLKDLPPHTNLKHPKTAGGDVWRRTGRVPHTEVR